MGVNISNLVVKKGISIDDLNSKAVAIDAYNILYKFLTTVRNRDGSPLMDSKGRMTGHLSGLFARTVAMIEKGVKPVYVFDGKPPELKNQEREKRKEQKILAQKRFDEAEFAGDLESMRKYASQTTRITPEILKSAKSLLSALGVPFIDAPSEGEAQAAFMAKKGDVYAVVSQDYDSLLFGAPYIIQNLAINPKKKDRNKLSYSVLQPEVIVLGDNLNNLGIDINQLIALAMLIGTDYNNGGIKGLGPKKALSLVQEFGTNLEKLFNHVEWNSFFSYNWKEVFDLFKNMNTISDYSLQWRSVDFDQTMLLMVEEYEFSENRIRSSLEKIMPKNRQQTGLGQWL